MSDGAVLPFMDRNASARRVQRRAYLEAVASGFMIGVASTICAGMLVVVLFVHGPLLGHRAVLSAPISNTAEPMI